MRVNVVTYSGCECILIITGRVEMDHIWDYICVYPKGSGWMHSVCMCMCVCVHVFVCVYVCVCVCVCVCVHVYCVLDAFLGILEATDQYTLGYYMHEFLCLRFLFGRSISVQRS